MQLAADGNGFQYNVNVLFPHFLSTLNSVKAHTHSYGKHYSNESRNGIVKAFFYAYSFFDIVFPSITWLRNGSKEVQIATIKFKTKTKWNEQIVLIIFAFLTFRFQNIRCFVAFFF